jgi:Kae1-associated kinase Bud32
MEKELIAQGAEAKIFLSEDEVISKDRVPKGYRHPELDKQIRTRRTRHEGKILFKAGEAGCNVPQVFNINKKGEPLDKFNLKLEYIPGDRLSSSLNSYRVAKQKMVMEKLGEQVARLHENDIIHGDLTTSNTILFKNEVFIIDFGLGFISPKIEDKAVDLHLIKQALEAKHFENWDELFDSFSTGYNWDKSLEVLERLEIVESRGRYKH